MFLGSFFFKHRARTALKGNWQTPLLVVFLASLFLTVANVWQSTAFRDIESVAGSLSAAMSSLPEGTTMESARFQEVRDLYGHLFAAIMAVPDSTYIGLIIANLAALILSPILSVGSYHYFIERIDGRDIGLKEGLLGRVRSWRRILWLYVLIGVRVFLWTLLLIIPGIIAAIRYSMAPYYLADDPDLTAKEALEKSKEAMQGMKLSYLMLQLSFVGWNLLITMMQMVLIDISSVLSLVAAQFASLAVSVYLTASVAVFYRAVSRPDGVHALIEGLRRSMNQMGVEIPEDDEKDGGEDE